MYKILADMKYYLVIEIGLNKVCTNKINISNLKLGDTFYYNYYMKIVKWDQYEK